VRCGNSQDTLHVHHGAYIKGLDPWEYHPRYLSTLCERCHEYAGERFQYIQKIIGVLSLSSLERLIGYATAVLVDQDDIDSACMHSDEVKQGFSDFYGLQPNAMMEQAGDGEFVVIGRIKGPQ